MAIVLTVTAKAGYFDLSWPTVADTAYYQIEVATSTGLWQAAHTQHAATGGGANEKTSFSRLPDGAQFQNGDTYRFRIRAVPYVGAQGSWSASQSATFTARATGQSHAPTAVPTVQIQQITSTTIQIHVTGGANAAHLAEFYFSSQANLSDEQRFQATTLGTDLAATSTLTGRQPQTTYYIRCRFHADGFSNHGAGPFSPVIIVITTNSSSPAAPATPPAPVASSVDEDSIRATWPLGQGVTGYDLRHRKTVGGAGTDATFRWPINGAQTRGIDITLQGVSPQADGNSYSVVLEDVSGLSSPTIALATATKTFTIRYTRGTHNLGAIVNVIEAFSQGGITLDTAYYGGANQFNNLALVADQRDGPFTGGANGQPGAWTTVTNVSSPRDIDGLEAGTSYDVSIRAKNFTGTSGWSPTDSASTQAAPLTKPGTPTITSVTPVDHDTLRAVWGTASNATSFNLRFKKSADSAWTTREGVTSPYNIDGLDAAVAYDVQVQAVNVTLAGDWSATTSATTHPATPSPPTSVTATATSVSTVRLTWQAPTTGAPIQSYAVQYKKTADSQWANWTADTTSPVDITGLDHSTPYSFRVRSQNAGGNSAWVTASATTQVLTAPGVPTSVNFAASASDADSATLSWSAPTSGGAPTGYLYRYRRSGATVWTPVEITGLSATFTRLIPGTQYEAQVRAYNSAGASAFTALATATTATTTQTVPSEPRNVTWGPRTDQAGLRATWDAPTTGASGVSYEVRYRFDQDNNDLENNEWIDVDVPFADGTAWQTLSNHVGAIYQFQVRAYNSHGGSQWAPAIPLAEKPGGPGRPNSPTSVAATNSDDGGINVTWSAPSGGTAPTSYTVFAYTTDTALSPSYNTYYVSAAIPAATTSHKVPNVQPGSAYYVRVEACNSHGCSSYEPAHPGLLINTSSNPPGIPTSIAATAASHSQINLAWSAPESGGAPASYSYRYRAQGDSDWIMRTGITGTSAQVTNLSGGTTFEFQVQAVNDGGASAWTPSTPVTATTPAAPPPKPAQPTVTATGTITLRVTWTPVTGATQHNLRFKKSADSAWTTRANVTSPYDITGLDPSTPYDVQVQAVNAVGAGAWSDSGQGSTGATMTQQSLYAIESDMTLWEVDTDDFSTSTSLGTVGGTGISGAEPFALAAHNDEMYVSVLMGGMQRMIKVNLTNPANSLLLTTSLAANNLTQGMTRHNNLWFAVSQTAKLQELSFTATGFSLVTRGDITASQPAGIELFPRSMASHSGTLYFTHSANTGSRLYSLNTTTRAATLIGSMPMQQPGGMVSDGTNLYALGNVGSGNDRRLYRINTTSPGTGSAVVNGAKPAAMGDVHGMAVVDPPEVPDAPTSTSATSSHDEVSVSWAQPSTGGLATFWNVRIREQGTQAWTTQQTLTSGHRFTGLDEATTYEVQVQAGNFGGVSAWVPSTPRTATTAHAPPGPPENIDAECLDHNTIRMTWTPPTTGGAHTRYEINTRIASDIPGARQEFADMSATSFDADQLNANTEYALYMRSLRYIRSDLTLYSEWVPVPPLLRTTAPAVPGQPTCTAVDSHTIRVEWVAVTGATNYDIRYRTTPSGEWETETDVGASPYTIGGLTHNTQYGVQVRSKNAHCASGWSASGLATTPLLTAPDPPTSVSAVAVDHDTVRVSWVAPTTGGMVATYSVRYREDGASAWTEESGIASTELSFDIDGLTPATAYEAQVRSVNAVAASAWKPDSPATATTTAVFRAPTIPDQAATVGIAFSFTLPAATGGSAPITTSADQLPAGLTLVSGVVSGTPTAAGTTTVTITYTDSSGTEVTAEFDIVVSAAGLTLTAPTIADQTATVGSSFSFALPAATGGSAPIATSVDQLPAGLALVEGVISGTPTAAGATTVTVTYTDSASAEVTASFVITVALAGTPPPPPPPGVVTRGALRPTLILPAGVRYPVALRDRNGYDALASGLHAAQAEWWSWTAQGGSDSAILQVAARRKPGDLRQVLGWVGHDVLIFQPGSAHPVWSGYVNAVTVPAGDFGIRRSLEGYANDLRVEWTEENGVTFAASAANAERSWQEARFGTRTALVEAADRLAELSQADVDALLDEYQGALGAARMDLGPPAGARLECRGHAGILDQRYFPLRDAGQYGDVTDPSTSTAEIKTDINDAGGPTGGRSELYQYCDFAPNAGHGPFSPSWGQYMRTMRFWEVTRSTGGSHHQFRVRLYALGSQQTRPGDRIGEAEVLVPGAEIATSGTRLDVDWYGEADRFTALPAAGFWIGLLDGSQHDARFHFDLGPSLWGAGVNGGWHLLRRDTRGVYTGATRNQNLSFDFFTGVTAAGLARWLASDADLANGVFGAHATNGAGGTYGRQIATYFESQATWRAAIDELAYADRLCYAVDGERQLRLWSADGSEAEPVAWGGGGANLGAFLGRRLAVEGEVFTLTGASYDALTGKVDFSTPGQPSATVAGARLGAV